MTRKTEWIPFYAPNMSTASTPPLPPQLFLLCLSMGPEPPSHWSTRSQPLQHRARSLIRPPANISCVLPRAPPCPGRRGYRGGVRGPCLQGRPPGPTGAARRPRATESQRPAAGERSGGDLPGRRFPEVKLDAPELPSRQTPTWGPGARAESAEAGGAAACGVPALPGRHRRRRNGRTEDR